MAFCLTHDMLGDFLHKSPTRTQFVHMRDKILNLPSNKRTAVHLSVLEKANFNEK